MFTENVLYEGRIDPSGGKQLMSGTIVKTENGAPVCSKCNIGMKKDYKETEKAGFDVFVCSDCGKVIYW